MIVCTRCKEARPEGEFSPQKKKANGRHSWCKPCFREYRRDWCAKNRERTAGHQRKHQIKRKYGLTLEQYAERLAAQGGGCAICGATEQDGRGFALAVDHDHTTGAVRGILCGACNLGIGKLGDSPERLRRALAYLEAAS